MAPALTTDAVDVPTPVFQLLAVGALIASLVARALAQALPGSRAGIGPWIMWTEAGAAMITQVFVIGAVAVTLRLITLTLRASRLALTYRLCVTALSAAVVTLVMVAAQQPLGIETTVVIAISAALLPLCAAPYMLALQTTRAAGLVLACVGLAAVGRVGARLLALRASEIGAAELFTSARGLATISFGFDVLSLLTLAVWLCAGRWRRGVAIGAALLALALMLAWGAEQGSHFAAPLWKVLAARVWGEILGYPAPYVAGYLRFSMEVFAWLVAGAALIAGRRNGKQSALLSLAIVTRAATDVPALALALSVPALLGPLMALAARREPAPKPASHRAR